MMTDSAFSQVHDPRRPSEASPYVSLQTGYGHGPFFVLFNVSSGREGERREGLIRKYFEDAGASARLFPIHRHSILPFIVGHAADLAMNAQGTLVIAGGDGTINSALPSVLDMGVPLGILPCGTCNRAAQQLGIPLDLQAAVHTLVDGEISEVTVGLVNERPFLQSASLGLYPRLLEECSRTQTNSRAGRILALTSAVSFLTRPRGRTFTLEVQHDLSAMSDDPHRLDVTSLFIGNGARQAAGAGIESEFAAAQDRGRGSLCRHLTAVALRTPSAPRLVEMGVRAIFGSMRKRTEDTPNFSFERLVVKKRATNDPKIKVTLDGETLYLTGPLIIERSPLPLKIIVPSGHSTSSTRLTLHQGN